MPKASSSSTDKTTPSFYSKALKEGILSLMDEIKLAFQWARPSILVAVHQDGSAGQEKARVQLRKEIEATGKKVREIVANRENLNLIQSILKSGEQKNTVFFVSGIGRHGKSEKADIYRALNFH